MNQTWYQAKCPKCGMGILSNELMLPYKDGEDAICWGCAQSRQIRENRAHVEVTQPETLGEKHMKEVLS